ncbi:RCL1 family protein [Megaselia abdita]
MPIEEIENDTLVYKGANFFKQRLLLSTLSGKPVKIKDIRSDFSDPGLREFEVCLVRLLDKVTNGTVIELNNSGTAIYFRPGLLQGGTITHDCCLKRGIGYYIDVLLAIGPFCKNPLNVIFKGVTNSKDSPSIDHIKSAAFPILKRFIVVDDGLELKIKKRGILPDGGGEVHFKCPVKKSLRSLQVVNPGMVKRIRGTAFTCKVSPAMANRTVESAKGVMLKFLPDVYINTDQNKGRLSGNSPGYGISLVAETTEGVFFATEEISFSKTEDSKQTVPEDLGNKVAIRLLDEIYRGGCADSTYQWLIALYMALGQSNVSKYLVGPLSQYSIHFLQHLRDFFSITFKLENPEDDEDDSIPGFTKVLMTCVGINYTNISKRVN